MMKATCPECGRVFDLLDETVSRVYGTTCVLTGAPGEDPDDCTTHTHDATDAEEWAYGHDCEEQ